MSVSSIRDYVPQPPREDRKSLFPRPVIENPDEHVKWEYHDFVGKYHLRKIKAEFPIPGLTVTRKLRQIAASKEHKAKMNDWVERTHVSNTRGMRLKLEAQADFLKLSETGRGSERVLAALVPAIDKRADAFHRFKNKRNPDAPPYEPVTKDLDDLDVDYKLVDPERDYRYGIMAEKRQKEIHELNKAREEYDVKRADVLSTDKLITVVAGPRGPPEPVRNTKTRQLTNKYHGRSRFSSARARRREEVRQQRKLLEEHSPPSKLGGTENADRAGHRDVNLLQHRQLTRSASAEAMVRPSKALALQSQATRPSTTGFRQIASTGDVLKQRHMSVATREFRRRNRFL